MKSRTLMYVAVVAVLALTISNKLAAQDHTSRSNKPQHHNYRLIDIGTFGGPLSYFNSLQLGDRFGFSGAAYGFAQVLSPKGVFVGGADTSMPDPFPDFCFTPFCYASHAFRWQNGVETDLGTLPGGANSLASWISPNGLIVGDSQNGETDPLVPCRPEVHGVLWDQNGKITDLGTLGGNISYASAVNRRGEVAGIAQNAVPDPFSFYYVFFCGSSNGTQTRGFLWQNGIMEDIGTLGGPDAATAIMNERGQIAGFSYINSTANDDTGVPTFHPFLWDKANGMKDLGGFGGTITASVNGLNERGEVVGATFLSGDQIFQPFLWDGKRLRDLTKPPFAELGNGEAAWISEAGEVVGLAEVPASCPFFPIQHGFLWKNGVMKDLGALDGSPNSTGDFINSRSQVVGLSWTCDLDYRAILWENDSMVDLNTLVPPNSPFLFATSFIDDRGEIAALGAFDNGDVHAVLLVPCGEGCNSDTPVSGKARDYSTLTMAQRLAIRRMMAGSRTQLLQRYHMRHLGVPRD